LGAPAERLRNYSLAHLVSTIDPKIVAQEILEFHDKIQKKEVGDLDNEFIE
jgi:hypothetical protein